MTACHRVRAKCWRAKARHRGHGNIEAGMACPPPATVCAERGHRMAKIDGVTTPARPPWARQPPTVRQNRRSRWAARTKLSHSGYAEPPFCRQAVDFGHFGTREASARAGWQSGEAGRQPDAGRDAQPGKPAAAGCGAAQPAPREAEGGDPQGRPISLGGHPRRRDRPRRPPQAQALPHTRRQPAQPGRQPAPATLRAAQRTAS